MASTSVLSNLNRDAASGRLAEHEHHVDAVALVHVVGRLLEADAHDRVIIIRDRDRRCAGRDRRDGVGQPAEAQPHRLPVVVEIVLLRGDREGHRRVGADDGHAGGHAGVVGAGRAILVGSLDRNRHRALRVPVQGHGHVDRAALGDRVVRRAELDRDRHLLVVIDGHRDRVDGAAVVVAVAGRDPVPDGSRVVGEIVVVGRGDGHGLGANPSPRW